MKLIEIFNSSPDYENEIVKWLVDIDSIVAVYPVNSSLYRDAVDDFADPNIQEHLSFWKLKSQYISDLITEIHNKIKY